MTQACVYPAPAFLDVAPCPHVVCPNCAANPCQSCTTGAAVPVFAEPRCLACVSPGHQTYGLCQQCIETLVDRVKSGARLVEAVVRSLFPALELDRLGAAETGPLPSLLSIITRGVCDTLPPSLTVSPETNMVVEITSELRRHVPPTNVWYDLPPGFRSGVVAQLPGTSVRQTADGRWMVRTVQLTDTRPNDGAAGSLPLANVRRGYTGSDFCDDFRQKRAVICFRGQSEPVILFGSRPPE